MEAPNPDLRIITVKDSKRTINFKTLAKIDGKAPPLAEHNNEEEEPERWIYT